MIERSDITGLVLAGGRGSRMGGVDKGLQPYRGLPLALQALQRLQPQVGPLMINANRNLDTYRGFGVPVWPDATGEFAGPLAGFLAGLERCETDWLVTVPCDTPVFPEDLVARLAAGAAAASAELALARTPPGPERDTTDTAANDAYRLQPVFCLMRTTLMENLLRFVRDDGRRVDRWTAQCRATWVDFDDDAAFANANTLGELQQLETRGT